MYNILYVVPLLLFSFLTHRGLVIFQFDHISDWAGHILLSLNSVKLGLSVNNQYIIPKLEVVQGSKTWYLFHATPTKDALWYPLQKIFWFCSKFEHKLLGTYTNLVQAVLSLAAGRTRSCPRCLSLTLLKIFSKM